MAVTFAQDYDGDDDGDGELIAWSNNEGAIETNSW